MYLSDRDLKFAVETGQLIISPAPKEYDTTSVDLHLDNVNEAKIWNVEAFKQKQLSSGSDTWLRVGKYKYRTFPKSSIKVFLMTPMSWFIVMVNESFLGREVFYYGKLVRP
jgi:deoxycytidine triphosphate deaminase